MKLPEVWLAFPPVTILAIWSLNLASSSSRALILVIATVSTVLWELYKESAQMLGGEADLMERTSSSSGIWSDSVIEEEAFGFIFLLKIHKNHTQMLSYCQCVVHLKIGIPPKVNFAFIIQNWNGCQTFVNSGTTVPVITCCIFRVYNCKVDPR